VNGVIKESKENTYQAAGNQSDHVYYEINHDNDTTAGHEDTQVTKKGTYDRLSKPPGNAEAAEHPYQQIKSDSLD